MKFGVNKIILLHALKHRHSEIDLSQIAQLIGKNNLGKTSLIRSLNFLFIDRPAKGSYFGEYRWSDTFDHYFPRTQNQVPWIIFGATSRTRGEITIGITRGDAERSLTRVVINHPYSPEMFIKTTTDSSGKSYSKTRNVNELTAHLQAELLLDSKQFDVVTEPQDWRRLLCDDASQGRAGLGILPFQNHSEAQYDKFRDLFSKLLSGKGYDMRDLRNAMVTLANVRESEAVLDFGKDVETKNILNRSLNDREQAMLAQSIRAPFAHMREHGFALRTAAAQMLYLANQKLGEVTLRLNDIQTEKVSKDEQIKLHEAAKTEHETQIANIAETVKAKTMGRGGIAQQIKDHDDAVQTAIQSIAEAMEPRDIPALNAAIDSLTQRLLAIPQDQKGHLGRAHLDHEQRKVEREITALTENIGLIESGQETLKDYVLRVHGNQASATLARALSDGLLSKSAKQVIQDEALIAALADGGIGEFADLGAISAPIVSGENLDAPRDLDALKLDLKAKQDALKAIKTALEDLGKTEELRKEKERLEAIRDTKKQLEKLESPQTLAEQQKLKADDKLIEQEIDALQKRSAEHAAQKLKEEEAVRQLKSRDFDLIAGKLRSLAGTLANDIRNFSNEEIKNEQLGDNAPEVDTVGLNHEDFIRAIYDARNPLEQAYKAAYDACTGDQGYQRCVGGLQTLLANLMQGHVPSFATGQQNHADLLPQSEFMKTIGEAVEKSKEQQEIAEGLIRQTLSRQASRAHVFISYLQDINKEVTNLNGKLDKLRFSGLRKINLVMEKNGAKIKQISDLAEAGQTENRLLNFEEQSNGKPIIEQFRDMLERGEAFRLEDLFTLTLHLQDQFGQDAQGTSTGRAGSNGTNMMTTMIVSALLLGRLFSKDVADFRIPVYVDEAGDIDLGNREILVKCFNANGFNPIFAHPGEHVLTLPGSFTAYQMIQKRSTTHNWIELSAHRCRPKAVPAENDPAMTEAA